MGASRRTKTEDWVSTMPYVSLRAYHRAVRENTINLDAEYANEKVRALQRERTQGTPESELPARIEACARVHRESVALKQSLSEEFGLTFGEIFLLVGPRTPDGDSQLPIDANLPEVEKKRRLKLALINRIRREYNPNPPIASTSILAAQLRQLKKKELIRQDGNLYYLIDVDEKAMRDKRAIGIIAAAQRYDQPPAKMEAIMGFPREAYAPLLDGPVQIAVYSPDQLKPFYHLIEKQATPHDLFVIMRAVKGELDKRVIDKQLEQMQPKIEAELARIDRMRKHTGPEQERMKLALLFKVRELVRDEISIKRGYSAERIDRNLANRLFHLPDTPLNPDEYREILAEYFEPSLAKNLRERLGLSELSSAETVVLVP